MGTRIDSRNKLNMKNTPPLSVKKNTLSRSVQLRLGDLRQYEMYEKWFTVCSTFWMLKMCSLVWKFPEHIIYGHIQTMCRIQINRPDGQNVSRTMHA